MDYTILIVIAILGGIMGLNFAINYALAKKWINAQGLQITMTALNLGVSIVSELNLKQEPQIKDILKIVQESVEYVNTSITNPIDKVVLAYSYSLQLCEAVGLEMTDSRKTLVKQLLEVTIKNL